MPFFPHDDPNFRIQQTLAFAALIAADALLNIRQVALQRRLVGEYMDYECYRSDLAKLLTTKNLVATLAPNSDAELRVIAAINEIRFLGRRSREVLIESFSH